MTSLSFFIEQLKLIEHKVCFICNKSNDDPLKYGDFLGKDSIAVHYFCLLFSNIPQNGKDNEGILGFLTNDIKSSKSTYINQQCRFCNQKSAVIKCARKNCQTYFHFVCGYNYKCKYEFTGKYEAYCADHYSFNVVPHKNTEMCWICRDEMGIYDKLESIKPSCCKLGWYHRSCIMPFALNAGYEFKCILCASKTCKMIMRKRGVYIPHRDPAWEKQPQAYNELLEKHNQCDLEACVCPNGRKYTDNSLYKILLCNHCASKGIHLKCLNANDNNEEYICNDCCFVNEHNNDEHLILDKSSVIGNNAELSSDENSLIVNKNVIDLDDISNSNVSIVMPKPICYKIQKCRVFVMEKFFNSIQ